MNQGAAALGTALGNAVGCAMFHGPGCPGYRSKQQIQADINAANARYAAALEAERRAKEANDAAAAAAAAEQARIAHEQFIAGRDQLAARMRADASAPTGLRGDSGGSDAGAGLRDGGLRDAVGGTPSGLSAGQKQALAQARVAAAGEASAACIFDGSKGCQKPVALVTVGGGGLPVPADVKAYIDSIPKNVRDKPDVALEIKQYEHFAGIRGEKQNNLVADEAVAKANPHDEDKQFKVMQDQGEAKAALTDETNSRDRVKQVVSMSIDLIPQSGTPQNSAATGPAK